MAFKSNENFGLTLDELLMSRSEFEESNYFVNRSIWRWGYNGFYTGGDGDFQTVSTPVMSTTGNKWKTISSNGEAHGGIKIDGTLWVWGSEGFYGRLGNNSYNNIVSTAFKIGTLNNWSKISFGYEHTGAIKTDGTLWMWGRNSNGELGQGNTIHRSSPVQVGTLSDWKTINCGFNSTVAIKTDGTLWAWGYNNNGQLGQGTILDKSSPVQVGTLSDWKTIASGQSCTLAIKNNGTLWAWGYNNNGELGDGTRIRKSSPVQIGSLTNWKTIDCGLISGLGYTLAIKNNGTLWAWGDNTYGQLGQGDRTSRSSPVQVGLLGGWKSISCGYSCSMSIRTDGTLWAWGYNNNGQLGLGNTVHRSSPIQVGGYSTWKFVEPSKYNTSVIALK